MNVEHIEGEICYWCKHPKWTHARTTYPAGKCCAPSCDCALFQTEYVSLPMILLRAFGPLVAFWACLWLVVHNKASIVEFARQAIAEICKGQC